ncbi:hypothetical protein GGI25_003521 [Coemansia spiralis]|uniref:Uncharacterized protein n=1 Tax=Coemansia spiralis TaxID=417178 RepID=A0A9W8G8E3_9FUNG|nr:hypothetical protein GGI25_003521 [Coemansia spiralis]
MLPPYSTEPYKALEQQQQPEPFIGNSFSRTPRAQWTMELDYCFVHTLAQYTICNETEGLVLKNKYIDSMIIQYVESALKSNTDLHDLEMDLAVRFPNKKKEHRSLDALQLLVELKRSTPSYSYQQLNHKHINMWTRSIVPFRHLFESGSLFKGKTIFHKDSKRFVKVIMEVLSFSIYRGYSAPLTSIFAKKAGQGSKLLEQWLNAMFEIHGINMMGFMYKCAIKLSRTFIEAKPMDRRVQSDSAVMTEERPHAKILLATLKEYLAQITEYESLDSMIDSQPAGYIDPLTNQAVNGPASADTQFLSTPMSLASPPLAALSSSHARSTNNNLSAYSVISQRPDAPYFGSSNHSNSSSPDRPVHRHQQPLPPIQHQTVMQKQPGQPGRNIYAHAASNRNIHSAPYTSGRSAQTSQLPAPLSRPLSPNTLSAPVQRLSAYPSTSWQASYHAVQPRKSLSPRSAHGTDCLAHHAYYRRDSQEQHQHQRQHQHQHQHQYQHQHQQQRHMQQQQQQRFQPYRHYQAPPTMHHPPMEPTSLPSLNPAVGSSQGYSRPNAPTPLQIKNDASLSFILSRPSAEPKRTEDEPERSTPHASVSGRTLTSSEEIPASRQLPAPAIIDNVFE